MLEVGLSENGKFEYPESIFTSVCLKKCPTEDPILNSNEELDCVINANLTSCPTKAKQYKSKTTSVTK